MDEMDSNVGSQTRAEVAQMSMKRKYTKTEQQNNHGRRELHLAER